MTVKLVWYSSCRLYPTRAQVWTKNTRKQCNHYIHNIRSCFHVVFSFTCIWKSDILLLFFFKWIVCIDFIGLLHINTWSVKYDGHSFLTYGVMVVRGSLIKQKKTLVYPILMYVYPIQTMKLLFWAFDWRQIREESGWVLTSANRVPR